MEDYLSTSLSREENVIPSRYSASLEWLHKDLGIRCRKAVGNGKLLTALAKLYMSVLQCDDVNKVRLYILSKLEENIWDRVIIREFTDILVLTSKSGEPRNGTKGAQEEDGDVDVDDCTMEFQKVVNQHPDVWHIE